MVGSECPCRLCIALLDEFLYNSELVRQFWTTTRETHWFVAVPTQHNTPAICVEIRIYIHWIIVVWMMPRLFGHMTHRGLSRGHTEHSCSIFYCAWVDDDEWSCPVCLLHETETKDKQTHTITTQIAKKKKIYSVPNRWREMLNIYCSIRLVAFSAWMMSGYGHWVFILFIFSSFIAVCNLYTFVAS